VTTTTHLANGVRCDIHAPDGVKNARAFTLRFTDRHDALMATSKWDSLARRYAIEWFPAAKLDRALCDTIADYARDFWEAAK